MRAKVREMARTGADVIKFATTGGASSRPGFGPKDMIITREEIDAIVQEAHSLGKDRGHAETQVGAGLGL